MNFWQFFNTWTITTCSLTGIMPAAGRLRTSRPTCFWSCPTADRCVQHKRWTRSTNEYVMRFYYGGNFLTGYRIRMLLMSTFRNSDNKIKCELANIIIIKLDDVVLDQLRLESRNAWFAISRGRNGKPNHSDEDDDDEAISVSFERDVRYRSTLQISFPWVLLYSAW